MVTTDDRERSATGDTAGEQANYARSPAFQRCQKSAKPLAMDQVLRAGLHVFGWLGRID